LLNANIDRDQLTVVLPEITVKQHGLPVYVASANWPLPDKAALGKVEAVAKLTPR
jgi:hypothetical protein